MCKPLVTSRRILKWNTRLLVTVLAGLQTSWFRTNGNPLFVRSVNSLKLCKKRPIPAVVTIPPPPVGNQNSTAELGGLNPSPSVPLTIQTPANSCDADGFTTVTRIKKNRAIKVQGRKKSVTVAGTSRAPRVTQKATGPVKDFLKQVDTSGSAKNTGSGFDFARAVQGVNHGRKSQLKPPAPANTGPAPPGLQSASVLTSNPRSPMDVDQARVNTSNSFAALDGIAGSISFDQSVGTGTRFSEMDVLASIKRTKLVEAHSDLYPPDPMCEDVPHSVLCNQFVADKPLGEGSSYRENLVCQLNREHIDGVRILPTSVLSSRIPRAAVIDDKDHGCSKRSYHIWT
ncbi:hypothetical protein L1987_63994 [Smallanthus sonchifolius]|uniref:Uncharacterized protein n=1 Tax=Smallanthus sonchifolius TaxID=185202 RepID=A0ACB9CEU9_9ASTR|nr:hypothetical protein L1987_63994 [Smallanthus sonchifolius]